MTKFDSMQKRMFDVVFSIIGLALFSPLIFFLWLASSIVHRRNGFFCQRRIGQHGKPFTVIKLLSMSRSSDSSHVTVFGDQRITPFGSFIRKYKLDELPQLINILLGDMSFVGPRPDVPGFADKLVGPDRRVLLLKPGITGPATIKYRNEERLLALVPDPEQYNSDVIWPDKVSINLRYLDSWSLASDIRLIVRTFFRY